MEMISLDVIDRNYTFLLNEIITSRGIMIDSVV